VTETWQSWIHEVRERLATPPPLRLPPSDSRQAAVLVPLYADAGELWTLLTRRSDALPHHRGQVAFPGGGRELGEDLWAAALRESEEEIGLAPATVLRLGQLDEVGSPAGFRIVPCVGAIPHGFEARPSPDEIDEVFAVPMSALASPQLAEDREVVINGKRRTIRIYHVGRHLIWGLTARILQNLLARLGIAGTLGE
jgi:8-oxo-dGTP pyrophosphatase MutT (NUDIX family)